VDVIEVVGHTDEQPLNPKQSNLDHDLLPVLRSVGEIASLIPADNAGLGLARAVSVVSVLLKSKILAGYKLIPLSGAQLVNTDGTLAISGTPGDIRESPRPRALARTRAIARGGSCFEPARRGQTPQHAPVLPFRAAADRPCSRLPTISVRC
jgi:hypothetical protein